MRKLITLTVLVFLSCITLLASPVAAIEYGGVGGKPANPQPNNPRTSSIFIFNLKGGQSATDGVHIFNNSKQTQTISVYPVDSELASGGAFTCTQKAEKQIGVGSWITMSTTSVTLDAGKDVVVPFTVTVPVNPGVGEHDGCIAIQQVSPGSTQSTKSGVQLSFRSAIRLVVTVPGKIVKSLKINTVAVHVADNGNLIVMPTVKNDGNVSLDTKLVTSLKPIVGSAQNTNTSTYPILPRSTASWNFELKRPYWGGFYHAVVNANYNSDTATKLGKKGGDVTTISNRSAMILVAPAPLAVLIEFAVVILIVAGVAWLVNQRTHRRNVRTSWKEYKVKSGDTVETIAAKSGVSWKLLAKSNKLKPPYNLQPGQQLQVPPKQSAKD